MSYHHLTGEERYQISVLNKAGHTQAEIAALLQRSPATISREMRRNRGQRGYRPLQADRLACERRQISANNGRRVAAGDWLEIEACLREEWSPEQIAGWTELASTETIYQHIYEDKRGGGDLHRHLRCQKKRRKRYGSGRQRRGHIPNRTPISERPAVVDERTRLGDWEGDLVIGHGHSGALVTLTERRSQVVMIGKVAGKSAAPVRSVLSDMLKKVKSVSHTLTLDNGKEFAQHERLAKDTGIKTYFADPYASWQRGLNEQINGLIRQYLPKQRRFDDVTDDEIALIERKLNNRPRKTLGFNTPRQEFQALARKRGVALRV